MSLTGEHGQWPQALQCLYTILSMYTPSLFLYVPFGAKIDTFDGSLTQQNIKLSMGKELPPKVDADLLPRLPLGLIGNDAKA